MTGRREYPYVLAHRFIVPPRRKTPEWVMVLAKGPQRFEVICFCPKWGPGCPHADYVLAELKPWYRARCHLAEKRSA